MKMKKSSGVKIDRLSPAMWGVLLIANDVWKRQGVPHGCTITSGNEGYPGDGVHSYKSKHYPSNNESELGEAVDLRIWDVDAEEACRKLREYLTEDFDIVNEDSHIHVEHDPK